ncbi:MAG: DUF1800 domain-containing protein [Candidatus Binataceae bacterium]
MTALARHLSDRLGYGPRPGDLARIDSLGADRWIEAQLHPETLPLPADLTARLAALNTLAMSPGEAFVQYGPPALRGLKNDPDKRKEIQQEARVIPAEAIEARILRAVYSPRQLEESLTDFWFNHFNVFVGKGLDRVWVGSYEQTAVRPHVLGRFRDLLAATAKHPAMLFYLDNWQNTAPGAAGARGNFKGLNENYARELTELHTLGVDGGYSQADVIALAKILTGWGLGGQEAGPSVPRAPGQGKRFRIENRFTKVPDTDRGRGGGFHFAEARHDDSEKVFLGQKIHADGQQEGERALDILARHPATARHISFKLAQYFLSDSPPQPVVDAMTETFSKSDGDIRAILKVLFARPEFRDPANFGTRFKTPLHYVISSVRATGAPVQNFRPLYGILTQLGQPLYGCLTPDGYKCTENAWLNADGVTRRVTFAVALASGHLPLAEPPPDRAGNDVIGAKKPEKPAARIMAQQVRTQDAPATMPAADVDALVATLGPLSDKTKAVVAAAQPELRAALVLGSPDFMRA